MATKITIEADGKKAARELNKVGKAAKSLGTTTENVSKKTVKSAKSMSGGYLKIAAGIAAVTVAGRKLIRFTREAVAEASKQQAAEASLAAALRSRGEFTEEAMAALIDDASALQRWTGASDDATIQTQAFALQLGVPIDKMGEFTTALENATAAGLPQETVLRGLAASYSGNAGALTRYIPAVRELTEEQLRQGGAVKLVNDAFAGQAAAMATTWEGAAKRLTGAYGDLVLEGFGKIITDSPTVRAAMIEVSNTMLDMAETGVDSTGVLSTTVDTFVFGAIGSLEVLVKGFKRVQQAWIALQEGLVSAERQRHKDSLDVTNQMIATQEKSAEAAARQLEQTTAGTRAREKAIETLSLEQDELKRLRQHSRDLTDEIADENRELDELQTNFTDLQADIGETSGKFDSFRARLIETRDALGQSGSTGTLTGNMEDLGEAAGEAGSKVSEATTKAAGFGDALFGGETFGGGVVRTMINDSEELTASILEGQEARSRAAQQAEHDFANMKAGAETVGGAIGGWAASMANAKSGTDAVKVGIKGMATFAIQQIGQLLAADIAAKGASTAATQAQGGATLAVMGPAAVASTVASFGANIPIALAALAAGTAAMTGIISAIGDRGIDSVPGGGRMTVLKKGSEMVMDPVGTTKFHDQMDMVSGMIRNAGGGVLAGMGAAAGGVAQVNSRVNVFLDGVQIAEVVDRAMADMVRTGGSEFAPAALVNP